MKATTLAFVSGMFFSGAIYQFFQVMKNGIMTENGALLGINVLGTIVFGILAAATEAK